MYLGPDDAMILEILEGYRTPLLGSNHPYRFYAEAQGGATVGSGSMLSTKDDQGLDRMTVCTQLQQDDLALVRWQTLMAEDPSQDPWEVIRDAQTYWKAKPQQDMVGRLVRRHASLKYDDPNGYHFRFLLDLDGNPVPPDAPNPCE
jgi:hypothetical protein